ncbi:hypothetical protein Daus18300_007487 [Diaporthe australafricana]|uniref:F-box domain-containing protein n=1 Tax=Diaporthe australafricana TaxID=127596 RepID=A0ABR3WM12_9PEZI
MRAPISCVLYKEARSYDPDVINEKDVEWTKTLHVLGFNYDLWKAFVSGPGVYIDRGRVDVENGHDPNALGADVPSMVCYSRNHKTIFPFHRCCYEILAKCLTGSFDDGKLEKDLLFSVMEKLAPITEHLLLGIDYGTVSGMHRHFWESHAGYELVVSQPRDVPGASEAVLSMLGSDAFKTTYARADLGSRVRHDPFYKTPYDIAHSICSYVSDTDVTNLAMASYHVHVLLQNNNQFWGPRTRSSLPWFFELQELLEQDQTLLETNDDQRVFQWAERVTRPEKWLTGPFMGVANRRRIWSVCEQLGEKYKEFQIDHDTSDV